MKNSKRIAFTLAMGIMVGGLSVVMNLGSSSVQPADATQASGLKAMFNQLTDDQKEQLMDAVKNQDGNISQEDLGKLADLNDISPTDLLSRF